MMGQIYLGLRLSCHPPCDTSTKGRRRQTRLLQIKKESNFVHFSQSRIFDKIMLRLPPARQQTKKL